MSSNELRQALVSSDKRYVWHPYTPMSRYLAETDPLVIERAEGSRLYDVDGRSYLDGNSSWWAATLGHRHTRVIAALCDQATRLAHTSMAGVTHEHGAELAKELIAVAPPGLGRVFYSDNGSTAVEVAMKLALQYWSQTGFPQKRRFAALSGAFHGETLGAASVGGVDVFRRPFADVLVDCVFAPPPDPRAEQEPYERAFGALDELIRTGHETLAALVIEPRVQGASGMRFYDKAYLQAIQRLCKAHDVLLVVDEVFSGYGRTGTFWAWDGMDGCPDLLCLGKGFTAGTLPMAATLVTDRLFEAFLGPPERAFYYGHTFCGNPLGARIAREVLAVYRDEQIVAKCAPKAAKVAAKMAAMASLPGVGNARALGMIGALDLAPGGSYLGQVGPRMVAEARRLGAYLRPLGDVAYVAPPLTISDDDLEELLTIFEASVAFALGV